MSSKVLSSSAASRLASTTCSRCRRALSTTVLTDQEKQEALNKLKSASPSFAQWQEVPDRNAISKTYLFADFNQAWRFMSSVALLAEKMDHHPEWSNVYNSVSVTLTTHDVKGVSQKDIKMAERMEEYASQILPTGSS